MAIKSDIRDAVSVDMPSGASEDDLRAEIDRLQREITRLNDQLKAAQLDRGVDLDVQAVLSSLTNPPPALEPTGRRLPDGRFLPAPVADGGTSAPPEPGAPRVIDIPDAGSPTSCEFDPDDDSVNAFDEFFNAPDPQLDKIRRFLLG